MVLLLYGGLLVLTGWQLATVPTGFIPDQDKGYLILNVQLSDAALGRAARNASWPASSRLQRVCGVGHTVGVSGQSLILSANAPNLGSMYVLLKPFGERNSRATHCRRHRGRRRKTMPSGTCGAPSCRAFAAPPVDGLGTSGGFKIIIEDRGNLGLKELQRVGDRISSRAPTKRRAAGCIQRLAGGHALLYLEIDRSVHGLRACR